MALTLAGRNARSRSENARRILFLLVAVPGGKNIAMLREAVGLDEGRKSHEVNVLTIRFCEELQSYVEKRDSLDEITRQMREEEITTLQQRAQQYQQASYTQIQQYQQQQMQMIQEKLFKAVKAGGDREKFTAIFPVNEASYFSPTDTKDVTAMVKTQLGIK